MLRRILTARICKFVRFCLTAHPARVKTTDITDVWDEPLNYIDLVSRIQIEDLLLKYRPSLLFVEHDAAFVRNVATKTVET